MKLAVVGAGAAGLEVLRHAVKEGFDCTVYEQTGHIGGTWNYTDCTDFDDEGIPVHTSMYKGLKTNLPKEVMIYEDFPYDEPENSYISHEEVLKYIHKFANHFGLLPYIKFYNKIIEIDRVESEKWKVTIENLKTHEISHILYDAVVICNGHFSDPRYPTIPGMEKWKDRSIHSHYYRKPDNYKDKRVLVIGAGPSGVDIAAILSKASKQVSLSYNAECFGLIQEPVVSKPKVKYFTDNEAVYEDGSKEIFDHVIYCTGYNTTFPFLSPNCKIITEQGWVKPLYKHMINIEHPTMAFICLLHLVSPFPLFGIQARFFLAYLKGTFNKTKEEMYEDLKKDIEAYEKGATAHPHKLTGGFGDYMDDIAETGGIKRVAPVIRNIFQHYEENGFKRLEFRVLNDVEFEVL